MNKYILLLLVAFNICMGCSSDDEIAELTPAEKLVGVWQGEYLQDDYGVSSIDVTISPLVVNQIVAEPRYGANDKSVCDNDIFFCDRPSKPCSTLWEYVSLTGSTFTFDEIVPDDQNCAPGTITLVLTDDNTMSYKFVDIASPLNISRGTLRRK